MKRHTQLDLRSSKATETIVFGTVLEQEGKQRKKGVKQNKHVYYVKQFYTR